jgi:hypothetical protein
MLMKWLPVEPPAEHENSEKLAKVPKSMNWDGDVIAILQTIKVVQCA